ncbi:diguanylate cyclase domain-containing protein [Roseateles sp. LKC17W]|uniref:diguanylate cyclase n=1 Tax=Pelomonas margarita TaxID=3299031 RepID=A0ABW7FCY8_9BURK
MADGVFLLVDVDGFKRIDDRYGHAAGDAVLVQIGARLRDVLWARGGRPGQQPTAGRGGCGAGVVAR